MLFRSPVTTTSAVPRPTYTTPPAPVQPVVEATAIPYSGVGEGGKPLTQRTLKVITETGVTLVPTVFNGKVVSDEEALQHYQETGQHAGVFKNESDADAYQAWKTKDAEESNLAAKGGYKTGIPALDLATGKQRLQAIAIARNQLAGKSASLRAEVAQADENQLAALEGGIPWTGTSPTHGQRVKALGEVGAQQVEAKLAATAESAAFITGAKTATPAEMQRQLLASKPDGSRPETLAVDTAMYEARQRAVTANLAARKEQPFAYTVSTFPAVQAAFANAKDPQGRKTAYALLNESYATLGIPEDQRLPMSADDLHKTEYAYNQAAPRQKIAQLEQWANEVPYSMQGAFLRQLNTKDNGAGYDFAYRYMIRANPEYEATMYAVLRGKSIMAEDTAQRLPDTIMNATFLGPKGFGRAVDWKSVV